MKKAFVFISIIGLVAVAISCHKSPAISTAKVYLDLPTVPYAYFDTSSGFFNGNLNHKATLGRVLFYDGHLSLNNTTSCGSCHKQAYNFADNVPLSTGFDGRLTKRNSLGLLNLQGPNRVIFFNDEELSKVGPPLFWDGRENILENLIDRPITNHVEMGIVNTNDLPAKLAVQSIYPPLFYNAYGDSNITSARISECIAVFIASIRSDSSRFAQYTAGNTGVLNELEIYGLNLFTSTYNCASCHQPRSSYNPVSSFHDIGLDQNYKDLGMGGVSLNSADQGKFIAPNLANVALTAPYMHDGRYKTLDEVLEHYSHTIMNSPNLDTLLKAGSVAKSMNIPQQDKVALIAFLNTLTDYKTILDPKFSNPFKTK